MSGFRIALELILGILLVTAVPNTQGEQSSDALPLPCDRSRARAARLVVEQFILPAATALRCELPETCPLVHERDRLLVTERARRQLSDGAWTCGMCGKARAATVATPGAAADLVLHPRAAHCSTAPNSVSIYSLLTLCR